jgi:hypothetical protein
MIQIVGLLLVMLLVFNWKLALIIGVFLYYFGMPF